MPALVARHDVKTIREKINDFSLSFIAPLGSDYYNYHAFELHLRRDILCHSDCGKYRKIVSLPFPEGSLSPWFLNPSLGNLDS